MEILTAVAVCAGSFALFMGVGALAAGKLSLRDLRWWAKDAKDDIDFNIQQALEEVESMLAQDAKAHEMFAIALQVVEVLKPFVEKPDQHIAIVGSLRRKVRKPGDVDILCVPYRRTGTKRDLMFSALERLADEGKVKVAASHWTFSTSGVHVDVLLTSEEDWGMGLLNFTGSVKFNKLWSDQARKRGYEVKYGQIGYQHGYGGFRNEMKHCSEEQILDRLGLSKFHDPARRSL